MRREGHGTENNFKFKCNLDYFTLKKSIICHDNNNCVSYIKRVEKWMQVLIFSPKIASNFLLIWNICGDYVWNITCNKWPPRLCWHIFVLLKKSLITFSHNCPSTFSAQTDWLDRWKTSQNHIEKVVSR